MYIYFYFFPGLLFYSSKLRDKLVTDHCSVNALTNSTDLEPSGQKLGNPPVSFEVGEVVELLSLLATT